MKHIVYFVLGQIADFGSNPTKDIGAISIKRLTVIKNTNIENMHPFSSFEITPIFSVQKCQQYSPIGAVRLFP